MNCRICGHNDFGEVIDLGDMPLVNNLLLREDEAAPTWPLHVVFCRNCSLAQLTEAPPPADMFDTYLYFSSQSQTMIEHAGHLVDTYVQPGDHVLEIASNDGYLLHQAKQRGAHVQGVDPARNVAAFASSRGIPTHCAYFDADVARSIVGRSGQADVVFANNVLAHLPDPNPFVEGIRLALAPSGRAHIEVPYVVDLIENLAFDTIYHEHQSYYSVTALHRLFEQHDLAIVNVQRIPIHGGSLHVQIAHSNEHAPYSEFVNQEPEKRLFTDSYYNTFTDRVRELKIQLHDVMNKYKTWGAYGAAAKGVILLNYFELDRNSIPWVVDISPHKQRRFVPGTRQPIVPPSHLLAEQPEACLLLPWNIASEICRQNTTYLDRGGRFLVPVPHVHMLDNLNDRNALPVCHAN